MQVSSQDVVLSLNGLKKSYGDLVAVKDLSLDIYRGEIFGFLGPNGAGKTTTISLVCGLLKSDSGEIRVDGHSLRENYRECKKMMGLCPQDIVIWESLTCLEQMEFTARVYDVSNSVSKKRALELLGIEHEVTIENVVLNKELSKSLFANFGLTSRSAFL